MNKREEQLHSRRDAERILGGIKNVSDVLVKVTRDDFSSYCELTGEASFDVLVLGINIMISDLREKNNETLETIARLEKQKLELQKKIEELERINKTITG